jgi:hypothetical protein
MLRPSLVPRLDAHLFQAFWPVKAASVYLTSEISEIAKNLRERRKKMLPGLAPGVAGRFVNFSRNFRNLARQISSE